jgi:hypothetical protein
MWRRRWRLASAPGHERLAVGGVLLGSLPQWPSGSRGAREAEQPAAALAAAGTEQPAATLGSRWRHSPRHHRWRERRRSHHLPLRHRCKVVRLHIELRQAQISPRGGPPPRWRQASSSDTGMLGGGAQLHAPARSQSSSDSSWPASRGSSRGRLRHVELGVMEPTVFLFSPSLPSVAFFFSVTSLPNLARW